MGLLSVKFVSLDVIRHNLHLASVIRDDLVGDCNRLRMEPDVPLSGIESILNGFETGLKVHRILWSNRLLGSTAARLVT